DGGHARGELEIQVIDQGEVLDGQGGQHSRGIQELGDGASAIYTGYGRECHWPPRPPLNNGPQAQYLPTMPVCAARPFGQAPTQNSMDCTRVHSPTPP